MKFTIVYGIRGVHVVYKEILADDLNDAFAQAQVLAYEEYQKIAGKVEGCPTFCDFWHIKTTANITEVQINNRAKYGQLWEQYMRLVDSKVTACAY